MSSKPHAKSSAARGKSPGKVDLDEDLTRLPDSSSDSEADTKNSADLPTTKFVSRSTKPPATTPGWQARRDAGRQAPPNMGRGTLKKNSDTPKPPVQTKSRKGQATPISSQSSSSGSKRKEVDKEVDINTLGKGMGDVFGRVQLKKRKKLKTFEKPKLVKSESIGSRLPSYSDDDGEAVAEFSKPELDGTPKKKGFITPYQDTPPKVAGFSMPEEFSHVVTNRLASPVEEEVQFIMPEEDFDEPSHTLVPSLGVMVPMRAADTPIGSAQAIEAMLEGDDLGLGQDAIEDARKIVAAGGSALGTARELDSNDYDEYFKSLTQQARCPMCKQYVNPDDLRAFGYMNIKKQEKFCRSHRTKTAEQDWKDNDYPIIDWKDLDSRIKKHHSFIKELIKGENSHYRSLLGDRIEAGQDRTAMTMKTNLTPGYYGTRGLRIMSENIMQKFTPLLKKRMVQDRLMSSRGFTPYVQAVLVPEVAVKLIMEDMGVGMEEARGILADSAVVGELLNEEIRDVVRKKVDASDESDG